MFNYPGSLTREEREEKIADLCAEHNCKEKIRKIHYDQFVNHDWHPHPPDEFVDWWSTKKLVTTAKIAWNCHCYRDEFKEVKQMIGI